MTETPKRKITQHDVRILRDLAKRRLDLANDPVNVERREAWYAHDAGDRRRPMVLCEPGLVYPDLPKWQRLECEEDWARGLENGFHYDTFVFEDIRDDHVVEPWLNVNWSVSASDYGVQAETEWAERVSGNVSSRSWKPPLEDLDRDFAKLHPRTFELVAPEETLAWKKHLEDVFEDLLPVRIRGGFAWTFGMTWSAIDLIGLEQMMLYMCTEPEALHRLMAFLRDDHLAFIDFLERNELLSLNNENDYIGSGSMGYTHRLPADGAGGPVKPRDLWALSESQETVLVGPDQFDEFVFRYQQPVAERFGAIYYGCCEPVNNRWHVLSRLSNLRRVSVSPWCDEEFMADACGSEIVFSRKPNPTLVSTEHFDENRILDDLRKTCTVARNCRLEIVLKDVHTLAGQPDRMARWVALARRAIEETA